VRLELLDSSEETLSINTVIDAVGLTQGPNDQPFTREELAALTPLELQLIYDWAMREHLIASGQRWQRRARPGCLAMAETLRTIAVFKARIQALESQVATLTDQLDMAHAEVEDASVH
jgi:hypothetical protein